MSLVVFGSTDTLDVLHMNIVFDFINHYYFFTEPKENNIFGEFTKKKARI